MILLTWLNDSSITSSITSGSILNFTLPSSIRVIDNRFSTKLINHKESSYIFLYKAFFLSFFKLPLSFNNTSALPYIEVNGVLRSWDIDLSKSDLNCSFFTLIIASFFSSLLFIFSKHIAISLNIANKIRLSNDSKTSLSK